ncbi:hypothetical protein DFH09DRAFT_1281123 [Mycena vulgaris]|nr:hypothetical protein DFH09DRAFT_1281123 [Mycena vulgaris]
MPAGLKHSARHNECATTSGPGIHFTSPIKLRHKHNNQRVMPLGAVRLAQKAMNIRVRLDALLHPPTAPTPTPTPDIEHLLPTGVDAPTADSDSEMDWIDEEPPAPPLPAPIPIPGCTPTVQLARNKRTVAWDALLPQLEAPLATYRQGTHGQRPGVVSNHPFNVQYRSRTVLLVRNGVFPTSPSQPRTGVSVDFLEIYRALFERSCDAITALAAALHTIYDRRGFRVISTRNQGQLAKDPFREGLAQAVQWYSNLRARVQSNLNSALAAAEAVTLLILTSPAQTTASEAVTASSIDGSPASDADIIESTPGSQNSSESRRFDEPVMPPEPTPGRAHRILRERCPRLLRPGNLGTTPRRVRDHHPYFYLRVTIFASGGDIQRGADRCFSYRHLHSAGDGPISYDPSYFISKEKVDRVRERIVNARCGKPATVTPPIPQEAIDACEASWDAANEKKQKVDPKRHDASGVFVMTCRHSQVLFLCNIDTPGEQQQYIVALMEEVNTLLPPQATIVQAYDVGCVTDHSLNLWVCQIVYSPRLRRGLCLTDAEGVERFWSRIRKLIGITRNQWNSRRIWMIDQYAAFVNEEGRDNLGSWIHRQEHKNLVKKRTAATKVLHECGVPEAELRRNWEAQKAAQTSLRSHAPARLRRELDKVLALQNQIDTVEKSIADVKQSITGPEASADSITLLHSLEKTHDTLSTQAEALYASLNIHEFFPELQNLPLEFINIRKRAVGSFYEWENLDRAVGGRREALGTKLHQSTRKAISKRQPALLRSIGKFNAYGAALERLRPPGCKIPIPSPLSTQLNALRDDASLYEDVWITPAEGQIPRWLNDADVRDGICALHSADRLELQLRMEQLQFLQLSWALPMTTCPEPPIVNRSETSTPRNTSTPSLPPQPTHTTVIGTVTIELDSDEAVFEEDSSRLVASDELDPDSISDTDHENVLIVHDMLSNSETEEDDSTDTGLLHHIEEYNSIRFIDPDRCERIILGIDGQQNIYVAASDIACVESRTGRLTGFTINALAGALLNIFGHPTSPNAMHANQCAILSTYDLVRVRYKASDNDLWRNIHHSSLGCKRRRLEARYSGYHGTDNTDGRVGKSQQAPLHVSTEEDPWIATSPVPCCMCTAIQIKLLLISPVRDNTVNPMATTVASGFCV